MCSNDPYQQSDFWTAFAELLNQEAEAQQAKPGCETVEKLKKIKDESNKGSSPEPSNQGS